MLKEKLTQNYVLVVKVVQSIFSDSKLANVGCLEKVRVWLHLKNCLASGLGPSRYKESNWLDLTKDLIALFRSLAEVSLAI